MGEDIMVIFLNDEAVALRRTVCNQCPQQRLGICLQCGCVLSFKTKLMQADCPLGKWAPRLDTPVPLN